MQKENNIYEIKEILCDWTELSAHLSAINCKCYRNYEGQVLGTFASWLKGKEPLLSPDILFVSWWSTLESQGFIDLSLENDI